MQVRVDEKIAVVGNNGYGRAPHVHIGAWLGETPLQVLASWLKVATPRLIVSLPTLFGKSEEEKASSIFFLRRISFSTKCISVTITS